MIGLAAPVWGALAAMAVLVVAVAVVAWRLLGTVKDLGRRVADTSRRMEEALDAINEEVRRASEGMERIGRREE